jgi:hypothetical protein
MFCQFSRRIEDVRIRMFRCDSILGAVPTPSRPGAALLDAIRGPVRAGGSLQHANVSVIPQRKQGLCSRRAAQVKGPVSDLRVDREGTLRIGPFMLPFSTSPTAYWPARNSKAFPVGRQVHGWEIVVYSRERRHGRRPGSPRRKQTEPRGTHQVDHYRPQDV